MGIYAVTGGSRGIGAKTVEYLRAQGHLVYNIDVNHGDITANLASVEGRQAVIDRLHTLCSEGMDGLVCCAGVVAGGHLIGRTLLEIIYGVDLSPYKLHFVVLLIGGGISAEVYMIYNILIAIRWGKCLLPVYSVTAVITIAAARIMVRQWGIMGAALNYVLSCSILFILFTGILIFVVSKKGKEKAA